MFDLFIDIYQEIFMIQYRHSLFFDFRKIKNNIIENLIRKNLLQRVKTDSQTISKFFSGSRKDNCGFRNLHFRLLTLTSGSSGGNQQWILLLRKTMFYAKDHKQRWARFVSRFLKISSVLVRFEKFQLRFGLNFEKPESCPSLIPSISKSIYFS